jgi:predicted  nucleic acid-binding Zn-ribbon protein
VNPTLAALVALQRVDTAAENARRRLAEIPSSEREIDSRVEAAGQTAAEAKARLAENQQARRAVEKDVAAVDARLAKFEDHRAAVKTNQEYTALLHEITTAKGDKDALENRVLELLEAADVISAEVREAEAGLQAARQDATSAHQALAAERRDLDAALARLDDERRRESAGFAPPLLAKYDQLLKQRRTVAVAEMSGETCTACHVRLRPSFAQQVRRNDAIVQCDSCQRILYFVPPAPAAS